MGHWPVLHLSRLNLWFPFERALIGERIYWRFWARFIFWYFIKFIFHKLWHLLCFCLVENFILITQSLFVVLSLKFFLGSGIFLACLLIRSIALAALRYRLIQAKSLVFFDLHFLFFIQDRFKECTKLHLLANKAHYIQFFLDPCKSNLFRSWFAFSEARKTAWFLSQFFFEVSV